MEDGWWKMKSEVWRSTPDKHTESDELNTERWARAYVHWCEGKKRSIDAP